MKSTIYYGHLGYGRKSGWSNTYIHISLQRKLLFHYYEGIVAGLLWPRSTSTNITTMITSAITRGRVVGLKRPMSTSSVTQIHYKTFDIRNFIYVMIVGIIMAGLMIQISYTSITSHRESTFLTDRVGPALLVPWTDSVNKLHWGLNLHCVRLQVSMVLGTVRHQGSGVQFSQVRFHHCYWNDTQWSSALWFCGILAGRGYINF